MFSASNGVVERVQVCIAHVAQRPGFLPFLWRETQYAIRPADHDRRPSKTGVCSCAKRYPRVTLDASAECLSESALLKDRV